MHVAVLGAGIMGLSTALRLARRGVRVTLFDRADRPFAGASRWNEGKIHLGYLYAANPSLDTARRILPGGLAFRALTEDLIGCSIDAAVADADDTFVVHRRSVVDADAAWRYYAAVDELVASGHAAQPYLRDLQGARSRRLSRVELERDYDTAHITAGFRVPERSVSTTWIADRFVEALAGTPRIEKRPRTVVTGVRRLGPGTDAPMSIETDEGVDGPYDCVVNALWEGRLAVDRRAGLPLPDSWSHRFRLSVFLRTPDDVGLPNTVIATGPFGDLKNYNGRDLYLSWYPTGLRVDSHDIVPAPVASLDAARQTDFMREVVTHLGRIIPAVAALDLDACTARVEGGWVCASGRGELCDPRSTLHRRDLVGVSRAGSYFSVDTGKYSIAPSLACQVADAIVPS